MGKAFRILRRRDEQGKVNLVVAASAGKLSGTGKGRPQRSIKFDMRRTSVPRLAGRGILDRCQKFRTPNSAALTCGAEPGRRFEPDPASTTRGSRCGMIWVNVAIVHGELAENRARLDGTSATSERVKRRCPPAGCRAIGDGIRPKWRLLSPLPPF
jgi:hypothetical protein